MGTMINFQAVLFILLFIGVVARKLEIISAEGRKSLSNLVIKVILPFNIIKSFCIEWSAKIFQKCALVLVVAVVAQIGYVLLSKVLYRRQPSDKRVVLQYATICSNAGFMGNPIVEAVYGSEGLLYASVALIPLRVAMWSSGLSLFTKADGKNVLKSVLTHPCIVAVYIGFFLMLTQIPLPGCVIQAIQSIGGCNTAISMVVIGAILAEIQWKEILDKSLLYYSFIRLIVIPVVVFGIMRLCSINDMVTGVTVLLAAMPAGSTTVLLADTYGKNSTYASACVFVSTMLSLVTLPIISSFLS